jgi:hypothetical protein
VEQPCVLSRPYKFAHYPAFFSPRLESRAPRNDDPAQKASPKRTRTTRYLPRSVFGARSFLFAEIGFNDSKPSPVRRSRGLKNRNPAAPDPKANSLCRLLSRQHKLLWIPMPPQLLPSDPAGTQEFNDWLSLADSTPRRIVRSAFEKIFQTCQYTTWFSRN